MRWPAWRVQPEDTERDVELPEDSDGGLDFVRALGKQFRVLRERAEFSQEAAAGQLGYGDDLISSIERGRRVPQTELLRRADRLYYAGGVLAAVADDLEEARRKFRTKHPAWFRTFVRPEAQAKEINEYTTMFVPGLLPTEAYARAIHRARQPSLDDETIERRVTARLARQEILNAPASWPPPKATFVIEESVLLRPVGRPVPGGGGRLAQVQPRTNEGGQCVEVAADASAVHVRDSKDTAGPQLCLTPAAWSAFAAYAAD